MSCPCVLSRQMVLAPQPGSPWADEMVLNPAVIQDPQSGRVHMLFRATGPYTHKQLAGKPLPYPIFLGYASSDDEGVTWKADFSRPALAPRLKYEKSELVIRNARGQEVVDYSNGCIEDPRLFWMDGKSYVIVACRMFPPGPYWIHDEPSQCSPAWSQTGENPYGVAAKENVTVNVLYEVDLGLLAAGKYDDAFRYVIHLTNPEYGENRDVMFFPERMTVAGKSQIVCLHRPYNAERMPFVKEKNLMPSIFICAAEQPEGLWNETATQAVLAKPVYEWEQNRIGASAPPIRISPTEWLLCYHGKQDAKVGYTQSFMILEERPNQLPVVKHRCSDRVMYAEAAWEMPHKFETPCVFITGLISLAQQPDRLLASYGAADEKAGVALIDRPRLIEHVRKFDPQGKRLA